MICCFKGIDNLDNIFLDSIFDYAKEDGYLAEKENFDMMDYFSYVIYNNEIIPTFSLYEDLYKNGNFKNIDIIVISLIEEKRNQLYKIFNIISKESHKTFKTNFNTDIFLVTELNKTLPFYNKIINNLDPSFAKFVIDFCLDEKKKQLLNFLGYEDMMIKCLKK